MRVDSEPPHGQAASGWHDQITGTPKHCALAHRKAHIPSDNIALLMQQLVLVVSVVAVQALPCNDLLASLPTLSSCIVT